MLSNQSIMLLPVVELQAKIDRSGVINRYDTNPEASKNDKRLIWIQLGFLSLSILLLLILKRYKKWQKKTRSHNIINFSQQSNYKRIQSAQNNIITQESGGGLGGGQGKEFLIDSGSGYEKWRRKNLENNVSQFSV